MNKTLALRYALLCLRELDQHADQSLTVQEISDHQGIPFHDCEVAVGRLQTAGYLETTGDGRFSLAQPLEAIHSLELIQAVYAETPKIAAFRLLFQRQRSGLAKALEATRWSRKLDVYPSDGLITRG